MLLGWWDPTVATEEDARDCLRGASALRESVVYQTLVAWLFMPQPFQTNMLVQRILHRLQVGTSPAQNSFVIKLATALLNSFQ